MLGFGISQPMVIFWCIAEQNMYCRASWVYLLKFLPANIVAIINNLFEHLCFRLRKHYINHCYPLIFVLLSAHRLNSPLYLSGVWAHYGTVVNHCEYCAEGY